MIGIILAWVSLCWFLYLMDKYTKLIKEYNKLVDVYNLLKRGYTFQNSLIDYYECNLRELLKTLRELNNLSLDNIKNDK